MDGVGAVEHGEVVALHAHQMDELVGHAARQTSHDHAHGQDIGEQVLQQFASPRGSLAVNPEGTAAQLVDLRSQIGENHIDVEPLRIGALRPRDLALESEGADVGVPPLVEGRGDGRIVVEQLAPDQRAKQTRLDLAGLRTLALQARGDDLVAEVREQQPDRRRLATALRLRLPLLHDGVILRRVRILQLHPRPLPKGLPVSC